MKLNVLFHIGYYKDLFSPLDRELGGTEQVLLNTIKFLSKNHIIEIERGLSPNYLRLFIDNKPFTIAGKRNIQDMIEDELFDIPYSVFKNIISISINNFKSFLKSI